MKEYIDMINLNPELKERLEILMREFIFNNNFTKTLDERLNLLFESDNSGDIHSDKNKLVAYIEANWTFLEEKLKEHIKPIKIQIMSSSDTYSYDEVLKLEIEKIISESDINLEIEEIYDGHFIIDKDKTITNQLGYEWEIKNPIKINILREIKDLKIIVKNIINFKEMQVIKELDVINNKIAELETEMSKLIKQRNSIANKTKLQNKI